MNRIFSNNQSNEHFFVFPIYFHLDKPNSIFIYNDIYFESNNNQFNNRKWVEASKEQILGFFKNIHFIFGKTFIQWKKNNEDKINVSDNLADLFNKANIKLMGINVKEDLTYNKLRTILLNKIKSISLPILN